MDLISTIDSLLSRGSRSGAKLQFPLSAEGASGREWVHERVWVWCGRRVVNNGGRIGRKMMKLLFISRMETPAFPSPNKDSTEGETCDQEDLIHQMEISPLSLLKRISSLPFTPSTNSGMYRARVSLSFLPYASSHYPPILRFNFCPLFVSTSVYFPSLVSTFTQVSYFHPKLQGCESSLGSAARIFLHFSKLNPRNYWNHAQCAKVIKLTTYPNRRNPLQHISELNCCGSTVAEKNIHPMNVWGGVENGYSNRFENPWGQSPPRQSGRQKRVYFGRSYRQKPNFTLCLSRRNQFSRIRIKARNITKFVSSVFIWTMNITLFQISRKLWVGI